MDEARYLTVSAINKYIAYKLDSDIALKELYIKGEVSNARYSKGHLYFVLKDEESEISAIMFSTQAANLKFNIEDGLKVLVTASLNCYTKKGTYNLIVSKMDEIGKGLIYQRFIELKKRLEEEGLFDEAHKKTIPEYPNCVGVITSDTGDAIKDILSTIQKRYPLCTVRIYKSLVQGIDAPQSIINAIKLANSEALCDVLIIARGGGSIEDLDCFNDPTLAYAIYESIIPIVSGVGHENDFTICDFVSDLRAPTPTGAAVLVVKNKSDIIDYINTIDEKIKKTIISKLTDCFNQLVQNNKLLLAHSPIKEIESLNESFNNLLKRLDLSSPEKLINQYIDSLNKTKKDLNQYYVNNLNKYDNNFSSNLDRLILINPLNIMKKGYTLVYKDNVLVKSKDKLKKDDLINIKFSDGDVNAVIK